MTDNNDNDNFDDDDGDQPKGVFINAGQLGVDALQQIMQQLQGGGIPGLPGMPQPQMAKPPYQVPSILETERYNPNSRMSRSPLDIPAPPFLVLDLETTTRDKKSQGVFHAAIGLCSDFLSSIDEEQFMLNNIRDQFFKPTSIDSETLQFHLDNGHYDEKTIRGNQADALHAAELIPWLTETIQDLYDTFRISPDLPEYNDADESTRVELTRLVDEMPIYVRGVDFDIGYLDHYAHVYDQELPWEYWRVNDLRTMMRTVRMIMSSEVRTLADREFLVMADNSPVVQGDEVMHANAYNRKHHAASDVAWEIREALVCYRLLDYIRDLVAVTEFNERMWDARRGIESVAEKKREAKQYMEHHAAVTDPSIVTRTIQ